MKGMSAVLGAWVVVACWAGTATAQTGGTATYINARIVSINPLERTLVVREADGTQQTVQLADMVGGLGGVRVGEEVMLGLQAQPGWPRVTLIERSTTTASSPGPAPAPPLPPVPGETSPAALDAFSRQVASLSREADRVDELWSAFRGTCDASSGGQYEGGRGWFSLWTRDDHADLSNGTCRDLYNQIVGAGKDVIRGMAAAQDVARRSLSPGDIRKVELRYSMVWGGWDLPEPRLQPTP
jgi:hypothetical protein